MTTSSEKRVLTKENHSSNGRSTLKNAFRYVPVPGGMRLKRSSSCAMHSLLKTGLRTRFHALVHLHHGEGCVLNSVMRYKFVSNVRGITRDGGSSNRSCFQATYFLHCPKIRKEGQQGYVSGSEYDDSCWNCRKSGDRHAKCFQPINFKVIAARKASFLENKQKRRNGTMRVLHEMVEGLHELMDMDNSDADDSPATAFIHESAENDSSAERKYEGRWSCSCRYSCR